MFLKQYILRLISTDRRKAMAVASEKHYTTHIINTSYTHSHIPPNRIPMKKTFNLVHPKIKTPRIVDSIKHDIKKFLKKERKKNLPSGANYWSFDCKFGQSEETATSIEFATLTKNIDDFVANNIMTIYIEITPRAVGAKEDIGE